MSELSSVTLGPSLDWILETFAQEPERGIFTLVGPTHWGKTHGVVGRLSTMGYAPVIVCNPAAMLPEEIVGHPRLQRNGTLTYTQPGILPPSLVDGSNDLGGWALRSKWALVVDELDKCRHDNQSAMLSLLGEERRLMYTSIPRDVPVVVCMNEPQRTMRPELLSRLAMFPFPAEDTPVLERPDVKGYDWLWQGCFPSPKVTFPERARTPASAHRLAPWLKTPEFWAPEREQARLLLVQAFCDGPLAEVALSRLSLRPAAPVIDPKEWAKTCTPREFLDTCVDVLQQMTPETLAAVIEELERRKEADKTEEMKQAFFAVFSNPKIFEAFGGKTPDRARIAVAKAELAKVGKQ